ncbi:lipid-A-disaccharide synthase [Variovorax sp. PCZ-1]|uniref:lipid-A-disaccharide synthase n=1 Tax=Variovorax sp. PCZ-1 TaxID=2835533 RepID=UPI001BCC9538|nr:lipid-A-disaccharide synthase [Variovorax sp. PCZ-1]MBS7806492.1 lipid-A-disaccharide synthase [Variovorax sp. PCZ-1]
MRIALVAGEASGDLLGGLLLDGLKARWPEAQFVGIGGPQMQKRGMQAWWPSEKLAVRGYIEVLKHYRGLLKIRNELKVRLIADKPDIFIGIDAPDFNLDLERDLKAAGIRTAHFVSPSIWAWRPERIEKVRTAVDHVLCIFPFEKKLYDEAGIAASYVGHPLAPVIPMLPDKSAAREKLGLKMEDTVVALLPGSRADEIKYLISRYFEAIAGIKTARSAIKFIAPCVPSLKPAIEAAARVAGVQNDVQLLDGQSHTALAACDVALVASGTATLEAALFKRPMVIAYNMHALSWIIMRRKKIQPWVGLPNILCGEFVVPELLQEDATPQALAQAVLKWLGSPEKIQALEQRFTTLHHELLRDTPKLAAQAIESVLSHATPT